MGVDERNDSTEHQKNPPRHRVLLRELASTLSSLARSLVRVRILGRRFRARWRTAHCDATTRTSLRTTGAPPRPSDPRSATNNQRSAKLTAHRTPHLHRATTHPHPHTVSHTCISVNELGLLSLSLPRFLVALLLYALLLCCPPPLSLAFLSI